MAQAAAIRTAVPADTGDLGRLGAALVRQHHEFDAQRFLAPGPDVESGYGRFLVSQIDAADSVVLVAERAGRIVGYAYAAIEPRSWKDLRDAAGWIHDVVVVEGERRRGTGRALVEAAAGWMEDRGAPRVILSTAARNEDAQAAFSALGFRRTMIEMTRERQVPLPATSMAEARGRGRRPAGD